MAVKPFHAKSFSKIYHTFVIYPSMKYSTLIQDYNDIITFSFKSIMIKTINDWRQTEKIKKMGNMLRRPDILNRKKQKVDHDHTV